MSAEQLASLRGSCSCGRYNYIVAIPTNLQGEVGVHFSTGDEHRRSSSTLLSSYLRVPLDHYTSQTIAFFPDETHASISRTFYPHHDPGAQRKFCGYCGTHLSYWSEEPKEEADYVHVSIGSLHGESLRDLERLGVLDSDRDDDDAELGPKSGLGERLPHEQQSDNAMQMRSNESLARSSGDLIRTTRHGNAGPLTWFEEMIDGSRLGRTTKVRRGMGTSADGNMTVTWEVEEYSNGTGEEPHGTVDTRNEAATRSKRKIGDVAEDDIAMKG